MHCSPLGAASPRNEDLTVVGRPVIREAGTLWRADWSPTINTSNALQRVIVGSAIVISPVRVSECVFGWSCED